MPTHRNITVALISPNDMLTLPEYLPQYAPKPSSATIHVVAPAAQAGAPLWLNYSVQPATEGPHHGSGPHYLFRLLVDGRALASWGCGAEHEYHGKTAFAIVQDAVDGALTRRALCFAGYSTLCDAAVAGVSGGVGGLEIRVHRVRARRRIMPDPTATDPLAGGDRTILTPCTQGLLQILPSGPVATHEPARFYQYLLRDALDQPLVSIRYTLLPSITIARLNLAPLPPCPYGADSSLASLTSSSEISLESSPNESAADSTAPTVASSSSNASTDAVHTAAAVTLLRPSPTLPDSTLPRGENPDAASPASQPLRDEDPDATPTRRSFAAATRRPLPRPSVRVPTGAPASPIELLTPTASPRKHEVSRLVVPPRSSSKGSPRLATHILPPLPPPPVRPTTEWRTDSPTKLRRRGGAGNGMEGAKLWKEGAARRRAILRDAVADFMRISPILRPGSRVGSRAGSKAGSRAGSGAESRAESRTESLARSSAESRPPSRVQSRAESRAEVRTESEGESRTESTVESRTDSRSGSRAEPATNALAEFTPLGAVTLREALGLDPETPRQGILSQPSDHGRRSQASGQGSAGSAPGANSALDAQVSPIPSSEVTLSLAFKPELECHGEAPGSRASDHGDGIRASGRGSAGSAPDGRLRVKQSLELLRKAFRGKRG